MRRIPRPSLFAGEGKVGLFKSLRNLKGSDLRYAIGYNMSTLRMLGVPLAGLVSLPYDIQQTMNTFKRFSKGASSQFNFKNPAIQRAGVLGFARNVVPKARSALPKTNVGVIDRYTNLYFGRQTRGAIKMINRGEGKKAALKAFFNPEVVDREIQKQAKRPTNQNVLHNWQLGTYMRAITGAPDPIRNNPYMQAKQYRDQNQGRNLPRFDAREGILDSKGEHRMMNNERFSQIMGGLEIGAFSNPEASIKAVMDLDMQDYMLSAIEKESGHMRSNLTAAARSAHRDRRRGALQNYYFQSGLEGNMAIGNKYMETSLSTNVKEYRTQKYGVLKGYYTPDLREFQNTKIIPSIEAGMMKDLGITNKQQLKKAMEGAATVNPDFAVAVNNLSVELGFKSSASKGMTADLLVTRLVDALGNLGITQSINTGDLSQFSRNIALTNSQHTMSVIRFGQQVRALGMTGLSDAIGELLISKEALKELGTAGGFEALGNALADNPQKDLTDYIAPGDGSARLHNQLEKVQGDLINVRNKAMADLGRHFEHGGNLNIDKTGTPLTNYFYSPHDTVGPGMGGMSPIETMLHSYMYDEGDSQRTRYFRSLRSMKYSENRRRKLQREGKISDSQYVLKNDGKTYKQVSVAERIKILGGGHKSTGSYIYTDGNGSVKNLITRKMNDLTKYQKMADAGQTVEYLEKLKYEIRMLNHLEQSLINGTPFVFQGFGKHKHQKIRGTLQKQHIKEISQSDSGAFVGDITGPFKVGGATKVGQDAHLFSQALMDGQKLPNEYMGFNSGGQSRIKDKTVSNEAQRRAELRREKRIGHNQIPSKLDIAKSIHIIPLASKEARKGPGMLNAVVVGGVSAPKRNRTADAVRDIVAIEYGGPATDMNGGYSKRTDGMFYLPSFFFTRAATESAAYLGLDPGNIIKNREKGLGREMTLHLKSNDPNRKKARQKARQKDRALKEIRKGQANLAKAQAAFVMLRRKAMRGNQDEALRMMNRRAMKSFNATENMPLEEGVMNDRFIDPDYVLSDSHDRFLKEGVMGQREFNMKSLGRVKRSLGEAGIGGGIIKNYMGKIQEIAPTQYASVWEVDGQSLVGRLPYVPVFDPQIYRQLLRSNSWEARQYLKNTKRKLGSFSPEYTQAIGDINKNSDFLMGSLMGDTNYNTLKKLIGTRTSHVREGLTQAIGLNLVELQDYQRMVSAPQGPGSQIGQIREALAGGKAKANLTRLYLEEMEKALQPILIGLPGVEKQIIRDKLKIQAARTASKVANAITTVWGRTSAGGVFLDGNGMFNALERTSILLEQGFAATTDSVGLMSAAYSMARSKQDKLTITKAFLDTNRSTFTHINMRFDKVAEKFDNDTTIIDIGETGYEEILDEIAEQAEREADELNYNWQGADRYPKTERAEDWTVGPKTVYTGNQRWKFDGSMGGKEASAELKKILFDEVEMQLVQTDEIARQVSDRFSFSTKDGVFAEKLLDHYNRNGIFPDVKAISGIDGRSRDGSGVNVFDSSKSVIRPKDFKTDTGGFAFDIEAILDWTRDAKYNDSGGGLEDMAKKLFDKKIHYLVDPDDTSYNVIKMGRIKQGVQSLRTVDMKEFGHIIGDIFHKKGYQESKLFIIELINQARTGKDGHNRMDKERFVEKFIREAGFSYEGFYNQMQSKFLRGEQNDTIHAIYTYYKNMKFRNY